MIWIVLLTAVLHVLFLALLAAGWRRASRRNDQQPPDKKPGPPITVLIAARNEATRLRRHLPAVLTQDWAGEWELLVVLDRCTDNSRQVLEEFASRHLRLQWLEIRETPLGWSPKKYALSQGIAAARHDRIALTDADCSPEPGWLAAMDSAMGEGVELVLGQGPYERHPGLLNLLIRFETYMTALLYTGLAAWGLPYMGVGRNLGYRRSFFERAGGFGEARARLSGDDDLLVNRAAAAGSTRLMTTPGSRTFSEAPMTWRDWIGQKLRHMSAAPAYGTRSKLILGAFHGLHFLFYLSLMLALCVSSLPGWAAVIWGCRAIGVAILVALTDWPHRKDLLLLSPLLDALYALYIAMIGPAGMFAQPKWRGK